MIAQPNKGGPIHNIMTGLRLKSGEVKVTACCASRIQFEGESCILAVSEDLPQIDRTKAIEFESSKSDASTSRALEKLVEHRHLYGFSGRAILSRLYRTHLKFSILDLPRIPTTQKKNARSRRERRRDASHLAKSRWFCMPGLVEHVRNQAASNPRLQPAIDQLLIAGIKLGPNKKHEAIDKILKLVREGKRGYSAAAQNSRPGNRRNGPRPEKARNERLRSSPSLASMASGG
jgi:hypothetical protein